MKKRLVSMFLILAMCMGLAVPAFATESVPTEMTVEQVEAEIQAEKDRIYATVYEQLEAQGVLGLMDIYKEILDSQIETSVIAKLSESGVLPADVAVPYARQGFCFTYGGILTYNNIATGAEVLATYMDYDTTEKFLKDRYDFSINDVVRFALGLVPSWGGPAFGALALIQIVADTAAKNDIDRAGGYGYVLNVHDPVSDESGTTVFGWDNHPWAYVDTSFSENIEVYTFPAR